MERGISVDNGDGNVAIGSGNVQVNGDGNVVVSGARAWPPVRSAYRERVLISAPPELIDREAELAELAAFSLTGQGCLWWRADAWAGKTALMAWFALHPPRGVRVVSFLITGRWSAQNDVGAYVDVVLEQLAELAGQGLPALLTPATREAHLLGLYTLAARACAERGERLVLLVDGLDEDRGVTTGPDAHSIAAVLPRDIPVIVSGRLNPPLPPDVPEDHPLQTSTTVRILTPSPAASVIRSEAERELKGLRDAGGLPRDLLGLITVAGGGLTADDLVKLTGEAPYEVRDLLRTRTGRTFTRVGDAYLLAHEELQKLAAEIFGPEAVDRYRDVVHAWGEKWRSRGWPKETPAYFLHGWFSSLRAGGDLERMVRCALDGARHDRLLAATGGDLAALTEIGKTEAALIDAGVPDFLQYLRLVIVREELVGRSDNIPPTLPWAWAKLGRWHRAEGLARSIVSDDWRARALVDVALQLHDSGRRDNVGSLLRAALEAAALCDNVFGDEREWALEVVSCGCAQVGLYDEAVESASLLENPWRRAELLCEVSRVWVASGEYDRLHALCRSEADTVARALLLATTAAGHAEEGDIEQALQLAEEARPEGEILSLVHIASVLLRAGDERAAEILDRVDAMVGVSPVLAGVVRTLADAGEYERALSAAESFDVLEARDWALCDVVSALMSAGRRDRARILAEKIEDKEARGAALREIVHGLVAAPTADAADGLKAAEEVAWSIEDDGERERALREVVEALAEAGEFDRAEVLSREGAPFKMLSRQPLGVVVEALARSGDLRRAREIAPDVPHDNGGFALVRGLVKACSDDPGWPGAVSAAAEVVEEVEALTRASSRGGKLDSCQAALALAEEGFTDLARGLLRGVEEKFGQAGDSDADGTFPIRLQIDAASTVETLVRLGEFDRARVLVPRLKDLPPIFVSVSMSVEHLSRLGLFKQAEAVTDALGSEKRDHLWNVLAEGAADHGDPVTAEAYARRVITAHGRVRAWTAAAVAYARAGDVERADTCLDEGLSHYERGPYAFITIPSMVRAFFETGKEEAGDRLLAYAFSKATDMSHWMVSTLLTRTVRALVAAGEYDRACDFVGSLPEEDGTLHVWIELVMALAEVGECGRAAAEVRSRGLPGDAADSGEMPFGLGRLVRVVERTSGRVLLARLLRKHNLQDLLKDILYLEPAAALFVVEACGPEDAKPV